MSWREFALGSAIHVKHGFAFKGEYFADSGKYIVLTPGNFNEEGGFRLRPGKDRAYIGDIPEDFVLSQGDLIVAMTEQGPGLLGSSATVPESDRFLHNQRLGLIDQIDSSKLSKRYLYFLFNTATVRGQISGSASGTKVHHTSPERIYRARVRVPDVHQQENIADILSAYDDLIENNRRRIELLERAARLLYEEWFVHLRFPGHEHVKIVDAVPEGWERKHLEEVAHITMGQSPESKFYNQDGNGLPFHQGVTDFGFRFPTDIIYSTAENRLAEAGDILFSVRAPVGRVNVALHRMVIGRGLASIRSNYGKQNFLFYQLKGHFFKEDMIGGGAIFAAITKKDLHNVALLTPTRQLVEVFQDLVASIDHQIETLHTAVAKITSARDLLLPRLMNGEIAV